MHFLSQIFVVQLHRKLFVAVVVAVVVVVVVVKVASSNAIITDDVF